MADLYSPLKPPTTLLLMGGALFFAAVFPTFTGKVSARFPGVYRAKEPIVFWLVVATYYLAGVASLDIFCTTMYGLSD